MISMLRRFSPDIWATARLTGRCGAALALLGGGSMLLPSALQGPALAQSPDQPARTAEMLASPWQTVHSARVRLIGGGVLAAGTGVARAAAVEMMLDPSWKTYWRMPGEAGVPPQFDFKKSSNVAAVEVLYPAPRRLRDQGGDAVGYTSKVVFPIKVTAADASKPIALAVELAFGVCKDICIPVETSFSLDLPANADAPPSAISAALDQVPRPAGRLKAGDPAIQITGGAIASGGKRLDVAVKVSAAAAASTDLFIEGPDGYFVPMAKKTGVRDGNVLFTVDFSTISDAQRPDREAAAVDGRQCRRGFGSRLDRRQ